MATATAVVTGGSSGLGFALAEGLGAAGLGVVIIGRDQARVLEAERRLRETGADARGIACDVSRQEQVRRAFGEIGARGPVALLVNVAGVGRFGAVEDITEQMIDEVSAGNLKGLMLATAAVLPMMRANGGGTIVSVLSTAALVGRARESVYCAAKWGARGFMEALRVALKGTPIRTVTVYPGGMRTPFWSAASPPSPDVSTFMDPREVARQILRVVLEPGGTSVTEMTISRP
jgi:NAD(P)-dependent dehydrogenase (short-subunit alcohol dehydrogenase family)